MLSQVTCDLRLDFSLDALKESQEALHEALDMTVSIRDGHIPDFGKLDEVEHKIDDAFSAIEEVLDNDFSIVKRRIVMKRLLRYLSKYISPKNM